MAARSKEPKGLKEQNPYLDIDPVVLAEAYAQLYADWKPLNEQLELMKAVLKDTLLSPVDIDSAGVVVKRVPGSTSSISKDRLLAAGVRPDVILEATKVTEYYKIEIRAIKDSER